MKKLIIIAAISACFAGGAFAQARPAPASPADPALVACRTGLDKEYKELVRDHDAGVKAGKMTKAEEAEYQKTMVALKTQWANAMKDGANLKECTDQRAGIKKAQVGLDKMQGPSPAQACLAEIKKVATEADKIFAEGVAKKTIDDKEAAAYKARDAAFSKQYAAAAADKKLSKVECEGLLKSANDEKAAVMKMVSAAPAPAATAAKPTSAAPAPAAANPALTACLADLTKEWNALQADAKTNETNTKVSAQEKAAFSNMNSQLKAKWAEARQGGTTEEECRSQRLSIKTAQALLNRMQAN